ncbi:MAG: BTAD domain-containing putative transcriptional regulator [Gemmatimonadales bacterium]|jgi:DNA-binding SARP family transcriptional activator
MRLHALGGLGLDGLEAASTESLLAQPKRMAILAFVVLRAPRGATERETLLEVFWPDGGRSRARNALRNSLHFLRQHLGADTLRSQGDALVVDADRLTSDVAAFEEAVASGWNRQALELYQGDLLPGMRVPGCPAFDRWLETERTRLRRAAADVAWSLSAEAERRGRPQAAIDHGRRAAALSSDSEVALRSLMRLLARLGDRLAAAREYDAFRDRLWSEHGWRPSTATRTLLEEIRTGADRASSDDSSRAVVGPVQDVIDRLAVLPFATVDGDPAADLAASGLTHGLAAALSRVSAIRVIGRTSIARYRERDDAPASRVAAELGVDGIVDGSVRRVESRYLVVVRLTDARRGHPVWADVRDCDGAELLSLQANLALDILAASGISLDRAERDRVGRLPTQSRDAFDWYVRGREAWNRRSSRDVAIAADCFSEATRIDPGFAAALVGLAASYLVRYPAAGIRPDEARVRVREAVQRALAIDPELGEAHAVLGLASGVLDADWAAAERSFRRAIELNPGHPTAHHWYGAYLGYVRRRFEEGLRELRLARELDPLSAIIVDDIASVLMNSGQGKAALGVFREALQLEPDLWRAHYDLGTALIFLGRPEEGIEHLDRAWRAGAYGADTDATPNSVGDWRDRLSRELKRLADSPPYRGTATFETALLSMLLGRRDQALRALEGMPAKGGWGLVMQYYYVFEDLERDRRFADLLDRTDLPLVVGSRTPDTARNRRE